MKKVFCVKEVSDQISQNEDAWAITIGCYSTREEAEAAAQKHWEELCDQADEYGYAYIGKSVYVSEFEE